MFHIELRQFPHTARAFNLHEDELWKRILAPWVAGRSVPWAEHRWSAEKAKLTIISGPELAQAELGMGRGWQQAVRAGEDVTVQMLEGARQDHGGSEALQRLKQDLVGLCAEDPHPVSDAVGLAGERWAEHRLSERLAIAEQAVWELLHEGRLALVRDGAPGEPVPEGQWRAVLLEWRAWSTVGDQRLLLQAGSGPPGPADP